MTAKVGRFEDTIVRSEIEALARGLVRIPSYTTEETPIAEFIHRYMRSIGMAAELQQVSLTGGKTSHNVVGKIEGTGTGPSILFTGHMDTAPALGREYDDLSKWKRDPFAGVVEGDWLYGKGSQDEKGGICAMLVAAKALLDSRVRPPGDVYFVPVQGHKRVSSGTRHLLASGIKTDYAINTENSGNAVVTKWVGRAEGRFQVRARAGGRELHFHFKEVDPNLRDRKTVFEQVRRLQEALGPEMSPPDSTGWMSFTPDAGLPGYPQYRVERITTKSQMHVDLDFQIRVVPGQDEASIRQDLERLIRRLEATDEHFSADLEFPTAAIRSGVSLPDSDPLVRSLAEAHQEVTGTRPDVGSKGRLGAAADASVLVEHGIKTILYGPGGGMSDTEYQHAVHIGSAPPDERISLLEIATAAKVYALVAGGYSAI